MKGTTKHSACRGTKVRTGEYPVQTYGKEVKHEPFEGSHGTVANGGRRQGSGGAEHGCKCKSPRTGPEAAVEGPPKIPVPGHVNADG